MSFSIVRYRNEDLLMVVFKVGAPVNLSIVVSTKLSTVVPTVVLLTTAVVLVVVVVVVTLLLFSTVVVM
ncbi:MAG: hypothetical protein WBA93_19505 [Microcoleaceae cyanobacterium]